MCKHIINVRNALLKHVTKIVNYVVLNCEVRPLNSFIVYSEGCAHYGKVAECLAVY